MVHSAWRHEYDQDLELISSHGRGEGSELAIDPWTATC